MPWNPAPTAPRCPACNTSVFPAEAVMAADRKPFHKQCVKCVKCKKSLNPSTINEHKNQLFCKNCYDEIYMPQEYCSGTYGGIITPEDIKRREEEERKRLERAERAKRERRCPTCDMKVYMLIYILYNLDLTLVLSQAYPEDSVQVSELFFHKICLKCSECGRSPDENTPMMMGPKDQDNVFGQEDLQPYCKFCFAKKFKVSAIDIAEMVAIAPELVGMGL